MAGDAGSAQSATNGGSPDGKRNAKYGAQGEHVADATGKLIWCASESEAERFRLLLEMQAAGRIANLKPQPSFELVVNNCKICTYRADFQYDVINDRGDPLRSVVEDVKGNVIPEFELKHRLYDALYPTKLSVLLVEGKAIHPDRPKLTPVKQTPTKSRAGWVNLHWKNRIPEQ
jgi:hypothetical protein